MSRAGRILLGGLAVAGMVYLLTRPAPKQEAPRRPAARPFAGGGDWEVELVAEYPHDVTAYTQGLLWHGGSLYESTGLYGRSTLRQVELSTGTVLREVRLPMELFGEGLARVGERLVQLTWQEGKALYWHLADLSRAAERSFTGEGWGLCWDGARLVMSDGSATLTLRDAESFAETGRIAVTRGGRPLDLLNELECVEGVIWANVYTTDEVVRIDPETGAVTATVDASLLRGLDLGRGAEVANGIAWRPETKTFLLTGKRWSKVFEVRFVPKGRS
ncbi:MAG TPA: glutaminyl-peptide cyclotransferase [Thermoanaerobaculia bacterium]|nr:glutaminyl-peptide cyclotransferase [Thermoanaerobaculia bacterium]